MNKLAKLEEILKVFEDEEAPNTTEDVFDEVAYDNYEFDEKLLIEPVSVDNGIFKLKINGAEYGYKVNPAVFKGDINALEKEFLYKLAYPGKALAWLKGASILATRPGGVTVAQAPSSSDKVVHTANVKSSSGDGEYTCNQYDSGAWTCTCPHHVHRGAECKHIKSVQDQLAAGTPPEKIAASATGEAKAKSPVVFSPELSQAIKMEIQAQAQDLGDELDGVEEVVGDGLSGQARKDWEALIKDHGFDAVTSAVKHKFL